MKKIVLAAALAAAALCPARAELGLGAGGVGFGGFGALAYYRPEAGRWRLGAEYGAVSSTSRGPNGGLALTREKGSMSGIVVHRQFTPGPEGRWYAGAALLAWKRKVRVAATGEERSDTDVSPYFGGGWLRRFGKRFFFELGLLASPWARLNTGTSAGRDESRGAADLHVVLGANF